MIDVGINSVDDASDKRGSYHYSLLQLKQVYRGAHIVISRNLGEVQQLN